MFSMESDPRLYNERLFVAEGIENWNWEFGSCRRIVVEARESRELEYKGVERSTTGRTRMGIESVVGRK
jgi:hypothetical protein